MNTQEAYEKAKHVVDNEGTVGWYELNLEVRRSYAADLLALPEQYRKSGLTSPEAYVDDAFEKIAPMVLVALVGVASGRKGYADQRGVFDEIVHPAEWNWSGGPTIAGLPHALGYVFHALHGAVTVKVGAIYLALRMSERMFKNPFYGNFEVLLTSRRLTVSPETLGDDEAKAWNYLVEGYSRWNWLEKFFYNETDYRASLTGYFALLNIRQFVLNVKDAKMDTVINQMTINPGIPMSFGKESQAVRDRAFSMLIRQPEELEKAWTAVNVRRQDVEKNWCRWIDACNNFINRGPLMHKFPHTDLFKAFHFERGSYYGDVGDFPPGSVT